MVQFARRFSVTNFFIATSALGFQIFVLYPWHQVLDVDFKELQQEVIHLRNEGEIRRQESDARWKSVREVMEQTHKRLDGK